MIGTIAVILFLAGWGLLSYQMVKALRGDIVTNDKTEPAKSDPDDYGTYDLNRFEVLAMQTFWSGEGDVKEGVELVIETFTEDGIEYGGYAIFTTAEGVQFFNGFLKAAYSIENEFLSQQLRIAQQDAIDEAFSIANGEEIVRRAA